MQNLSGIFQLILKLKEIIFALATLLVFGLGLWLTVKLIPVNQSIDSLKFRASAHEMSIDQLQRSSYEMQKDITIIRENTAFIRGYLEKK